MKVFIVRKTNVAYNRLINPWMDVSDTKVFETYETAIDYIKYIIESKRNRGELLSCYYDVLNDKEELKRFYIMKNRTEYETIYFEIIKEETVEPF